MQSQQRDTRLIEAGFPCHQVGAETQRERGASNMLPPIYYLHVWWARRPLTPSRAAILASLLPAETDPEWFLRQLGIEKVEALVNGEPWTLTDEKEFKRIASEGGAEVFIVDRFAEKWLEQENQRREANCAQIAQLVEQDSSLAHDPVVERWRKESRPLPGPLPKRGAKLPVRRVPADPAWAKERIEWEKEHDIRTKDDLYGYPRAFAKNAIVDGFSQLTVLDPTAGGGSIPFEALRLGCRVIANELNPVATVILHATLDYPARFGATLVNEITKWGSQLLTRLEQDLSGVFPDGQKIPPIEEARLAAHLARYPELREAFSAEAIVDYLHVRQVTCPHCAGEAPLLNTCWLSKEGEQWGVQVIADGKPRGGKVRFETYRVERGKGPGGEDPNMAYVRDAEGTCVHCKQAISQEEIKAQACGSSPHGAWVTRLYCIVAVRRQPRLDSRGELQRDRNNAIKTEKMTFFRSANQTDLTALEQAKVRLAERLDSWESNDLIPSEEIPAGAEFNRKRIYGYQRWRDLFTPRQLLCHGLLVEELNRLKPAIREALGEERARAVVTYLQFAIDKGLDYNCDQTRWEYTRGVVKGMFGRKSLAVKWTFGEMIFTGSNSGLGWCLSQIAKAYREIADLLLPITHQNDRTELSLQIGHGSAAHLDGVGDRSVDLVCMDPPYYHSVQYAQLSDHIYVWMRRTLGDFYPGLFVRRLTDKTNEAVANPSRDGSMENAKAVYERMMGEIFAECRRVLKDDGLMLLMFTHKDQDAWDALTRAIIQSGWMIASCFPVDSEAEEGLGVKETASTLSTIFLACRKRSQEANGPATWTGFGGTGVQQRVRAEVQRAMKDFERLRLNPVDEMVAAYGRALRVLSEQWPVLGEDDQPVSPIRAMNEASRVVAQHQIARLTGGRLKVDDLNPEAAMALTLYGIYGLAELPYDDARNIANSLGIPLQSRAGGYNLDGERMVGMNPDATSGRRRRTTSEEAEESGYHAPLVLKGSKLRLARPDERNPKRLERPQTEWDILHGLLTEYQRGDVPVARAYLNRHAEGRQQLILDLLHVWAEEMPDEKLRKEAQTLLFGLKSAQTT
jgi:adenine-specific DNA methylase